MRPAFKYKIGKVGQLQLWWNCQSCNKTIGLDCLTCSKCGAKVREPADVIHAIKQRQAARDWYKEEMGDNAYSFKRSV